MTRLTMLPGAWQRLFGHAMRLIDDIGPGMAFEECVAIATEFLAALPEGRAQGGASA